MFVDYCILFIYIYIFNYFIVLNIKNMSVCCVYFKKSVFKPKTAKKWLIKHGFGEADYVKTENTIIFQFTEKYDYIDYKRMLVNENIIVEFEELN